MSQHRFTDARRLLGDLLNRHETAPAATRLIAYVDDAGFATVAEQDAFVAVLEQMQLSGAVELKHRKRDGLVRLEAVHLASPEAAYRWLDREPAALTATAELARILEARAWPETYRVLIEEVRAGWSRKVRVFGLRPGQSDTLRKVLALAEALDRRADRPDLPQVDVRTFAREVTGDSKALKDNTASVLAVLRRLRPALAEIQAIETGELLATLGVVAMAHPLLLSGAVALDGQPLPRLDFIGIPPEDIHRLTLPTRPAYVLMVENQASFVRHAREVNRADEGLIVYTGGFPSRAILAAIVSLCERAKTPICHWGDMDPGGVRIFIHLETALAEVGVELKPHLMSVSLLREHGIAAPSVAARRLSVPSGSAMAQLESWIGSTNCLALEQEAISPRRPSDAQS